MFPTRRLQLAINDVNQELLLAVMDYVSESILKAMMSSLKSHHKLFRGIAEAKLGVIFNMDSSY